MLILFLFFFFFLRLAFLNCSTQIYFASPFNLPSTDQQFIILIAIWKYKVFKKGIYVTSCPCTNSLKLHVSTDTKVSHVPWFQYTAELGFKPKRRKLKELRVQCLCHFLSYYLGLICLVSPVPNPL